MTYLIAYAYEESPKWAPWPQSDITRVYSMGITANRTPTIQEALYGVKLTNKKAKNLRILSIDLIASIKDEKPEKPETVNNLNLQIMDTKGVDLGYAELVDTLADVVALAMKVGEAVSDGIQLNDAFLLLAEAKNIEEIYKDAPQAFAEFKDLSPEEAALAEAALAVRLNAEPGSVVDIIRQAINLITRGYVYFSDVAGFVKQFKKAA